MRKQTRSVSAGDHAAHARRYDTALLEEVGLLNLTAGDTGFHGLYDWQTLNATTNETIAAPSPCQNPCVDPTDNVRTAQSACPATSH